MTGLNPFPPERSFDPWNFRTEAAVELSGARLTGYRLEAVDGVVGKVTGARLDPGDSYLVATIGKLFGQETVLPAGIVNHVDRTERRVYLDRSRDEIKQAPRLRARGVRRPPPPCALAGYYAHTPHPSR